jgi:hypothetical protein
MNAKYLLGIALAAAAAVAACGGGDDPNTLGDEKGTGGEAPARVPGKTGGNGSGGDTNNPPPDTGGTQPQPNAGGGNATNSPAGQKFFVDNVFPFLKTGCGGCHGGAGAGGAPTWINNADALASYKLQFQMGYVVTNSRIVLKAPHGGSTTNELSTAQKTTFNQWVAMELKDGGNKATPNVMEKLGGCLDQTKFNAIGLQNLRTIRRGNENANNCTGCDNAQCSTCHAGGEADFVNSFGVSTAILPANNTFVQTQKQPFISKYFGVSPTGEPIASDAIQKKADATATAKPYTHPMFRLSTAQQTALKAFVDDAVSKYKAGTCAATPAP